MARQIQLRQGTTAEHNTFTGALGEITYDTNKKVVVTHDGVTVGGHPNAAIANADGTISLIKKDGGLFDTLTPSTDLVGYAPIAWAQSTPPSGYLAMMGQGISQASYPKLHSIYGSNLPDMRGLHIRGLDGGRGMDSDPWRGVLSYQGDDIRSHSHTIELGSVGVYSTATGAGYGPHNSSHRGTFNTGGAETRVKNIAFLYIVKAG